jgi:predicted nuclease of predicted toxin-antitoxin system
VRLLLDEQLSPKIAEQLQRHGHDVLSVAEAGLRGQEDAALLSWASSQERAVVTNNIRDFRPLHANYLSASTTHYGIILLPSSKFSLRVESLGEVVNALERLLSEHPQPEALLGREIFL